MTPAPRSAFVALLGVVALLGAITDGGYVECWVVAVMSEGWVQCLQTPGTTVFVCGSIGWRQ